jgi:50S ribosomal subunit-associated GTPase HflX
MENKKEMLLSYIRANTVPILVDFISGKDINDAVVLPANVDVKELNGHYNGADFMPPKWLNEILSTDASKILVIDKIDAIAKEEQLKFCELLEYRKISTFELPKNCVIIVTATEVNKDKINEEIFSLVARI